MNTKPLSRVMLKLAAALWLLTLCAAPAQTGVPLWTNRYNRAGSGNAQAAAIAVDGSGNVIVTGSSAGPNTAPFNEDYTTIKYSNAGVPLWTNCYNGPANSSDQAIAVAVDASGNVIVTGYSFGNGSSEDFATVAYSPDGVPLWTNRYNGPANDTDYVSALAVDGSGNVIVTGVSGNVSDYATIKYSGAGVPLWTNRYDGPAHGYDQAFAVAVDSSGNVYVTGNSYDTNSGEDYTTIKYSPAGVPLWTNRYNGPANDADYASALAVDGAGNVIVAGDSWNGSHYDFATIKYSSSGAELWTRRYNEPFLLGSKLALAVDDSGNVFVAALSFDPALSGGERVTLKYSGAGALLWANRFIAWNGVDIPAIAVDGAGNVFVTGPSLNPNSGTNSYPVDYATVAYSSAGISLWTNRYNGSADHLDIAKAVAVDGSGNVFVTGYSFRSDNNSDYATIKYSGDSLLPIPLNHQIIGNVLVLSWTNAAFSLQSAPAVQGTYTNISGATSPYTNVISETQRYFRLRGN